jgi:hypothetical protein
VRHVKITVVAVVVSRVSTAGGHPAPDRLGDQLGIGARVQDFLQALTDGIDGALGDLQFACDVLDKQPALDQLQLGAGQGESAAQGRSPGRAEH